jgi:hypothetical protein
VSNRGATFHSALGLPMRSLNTLRTATAVYWPDVLAGGANMALTCLR